MLIKAVAFSSGYKSLETFCRNFRRFKGMSASEYARRSR
ncbi:MAG: helix-turn-helix domain-containing protein [Bacteroidales bacterium]|nr:helix-turn-helix domain-containing protein [Bacteroidales bacterium]